MSFRTKGIPNISTIKTKDNGSVNGGLKLDMWKAVLQELEDMHVEVATQVDELGKQVTINSQLNASISTKDGLITELTQRNQEKEGRLTEQEKQISEQTAEIQRLRYDNTSLEAKLADAIAALKDAGKHSKSEQNEAVKEAIQKYIKEVAFKKVKFARGDRLDRLTRETYDDTKGNLGIGDPEQTDSYASEDEFLRIYTSHVTGELNNRRQYVQSRILEAMQSKSNRSVFGGYLWLCS